MFGNAPENPIFSERAEHGNAKKSYYLFMSLCESRKINQIK